MYLIVFLTIITNENQVSFIIIIINLGITMVWYVL